VRNAGIDLSYDPYGHIALADIPLASLIKQRVQRRFAARGEKVQITDVTLGYELRCAQPLPFDIDYTRTLGHGAVRFLLREAEDERLAQGGFVCLDGVNMVVLPFSDLKDPATGRTRVRLVDTDSEHYRVARDYMIRLTPANLANDATSQRLAEAAKMAPDAFRDEFSKLWPDKVTSNK
jgi:6-phosphofructokinase 1